MLGCCGANGFRIYSAVIGKEFGGGSTRAERFLPPWTYQTLHDWLYAHVASYDLVASIPVNTLRTQFFRGWPATTGDPQPTYFKDSVPVPNYFDAPRIINNVMEVFVDSSFALVYILISRIVFSSPTGSIINFSSSSSSPSVGCENLEIPFDRFAPALTIPAFPTTSTQTQTTIMRLVSGSVSGCIDPPP